jgi:hypothetical protein
MASIIPGRLAEYRKRLSDPGRRSTIPNAYLQRLDPSLYAKRQTNTANAKRTALNNERYDPLRQLSGSDIYSLAKNLSSLQYDPQITEATRQRDLAIANDNALLSRISGYNQMASSALATAHEQAQTGATQLAQQLAGTRSSTLGAVDQTITGAQQFAADDAELRGSQNTAGMGQRLTQDFLQQRAGIASNLAAQENAGNTQAQGFAGLLSMMQGAQAIQGQDNLARISIGNANREAGLSADITKLVGAKGSAQAEALTNLRSSEFEKAATVQGLNLKGAAQDLQAKKQAADQAYKQATFKANQSYRAATLELRKLVAQQAHGDRSAALRQRIREATARQKDAAGRLTLAQNREARLAEQAGKTAKSDTVNGIKLRTPLQQSDFSTKVQHVANGIVPALKSGKGIENPNYDPKKPKGAGNPQWLIPPRKGGYNRHQAADILKKQPNAPEELIITAALDAAYDHHLSPATVAALHNAGIAVKNLPYKTRSRRGAASYPVKGGRGAGA